MTNIAELLRNAPKGIKLYSPLFGDVRLVCVNCDNNIFVETEMHDNHYFAYNGAFRMFGCYPHSECLLFPGKECRTWEEYKINTCKFKVLDWIVRNNGSSDIPIQVYGLKKDRYLVINMLGTKGEVMITDQDKWRLWSIADAKEGDVLAVDWNEEDGHVQKDGSVKWQKIVIFKSISEFGVEGYGCTFRNNKLAFDTDVPYYSTTWTRTLKPATQKQRDLLFQKMKEEGYVWDDEKKELRKIIKPKFNVGDWITNDTWTHCIQSISDGFYHFLEGGRLDFGKIDGYYRLWEISDARNGDVLVLNGFSKEYKWIGIFKALTSDTSFSSHCHYNCGMCEFITDIARCTKHGIKYNDIRPATNEERDILFAKMREAGYQWDADKKELRKIKPHYNISNFHAGMPVLVRDNNKEWRYVPFSHITNGQWVFNAVGTVWEQCIPYNDDTKHLLGTTDMCDERFINW